MRPATFDTDRSVTDSGQSTAVSFQKLPDAAVKSVSAARHGQGPCVKRNDQVIDQFEVKSKDKSPLTFRHRASSI